jgi:hypothetical protein
MKSISTLLSIIIIGITMGISAQNAPIVTLGAVSTTATTAIVPITAVDFNNIRACDLRILYDPTIAQPTSFSIAPEIGGNINVNFTIPGVIIIGWYQSVNITRPNGSTIFNISFNKVSSGTTNLSFDSSRDDYDCQFYFNDPIDGRTKPLNDSPESSYYIPGSLTFYSITDCPVANAGPDKTLSSSNTQVTLEGSSSLQGVSYLWTTNDGNIVSGANTATPVVNAAGTYTLTVTNPSNNCSSTDFTVVSLIANAPVTFAPVLTACAGDNIEIPIKVTGFNNIGAVSLILEFDHSVLTFVSGTNTGGFPGLSFGNSIPGRINIGSNTSDPAGHTIADNSVFFILNFIYNGGTSDLEWFDDGESCEYTKTSTYDFEVLNDTPQSLFYIDGSVGPAAP